MRRTTANPWFILASLAVFAGGSYFAFQPDAPRQRDARAETEAPVPNVPDRVDHAAFPSFAPGGDSEGQADEDRAPGSLEPEENEEDEKSPELQKWYFEKWHQQYGAVLPPEVMRKTLEEVEAIPSEDATAVVNSWEYVGPWGMAVKNQPGTVYSGRVLDIDTTYFLKVASASGGLFNVLFGATPITEQLPSLAIGSVAVQPGTDGQVILVGTGEPFIRGGAGLWRTTNGGTSWSEIYMYPYSPSGFYRIRFNPQVPNEVHAATTDGYYRSTDAGLTWNRFLTGHCTDLAIRTEIFFTNLYTVRWGDGLYSSFDGGLNWSKVTAPGIPTTNVGRGSVTMAVNPSYAYVCLARNDNNETLGVYKTTNGGTSWTNVTPPDNFLGGQGWYDNVIAASPTNFNVCLVGGVGMWRTVDGGASWQPVSDVDVHVDHHAIHWSDGNTVWCGNDGGLSVSSDQGATFNTNTNALPITQYVNFDVSYGQPWVMCGGSQDNGLSVTSNWGGNWDYTIGGDGGGVTIDPVNASRIWSTLGVYGGAWAFHVLRSNNGGQDWEDTGNNGMIWSGQWYTKIRNDKVPPVYLYTDNWLWVYKSIDDGSNWTAVNPTFDWPVYNLEVGRYEGGTSTIYACLSPQTQPFTGEHLQVMDNGTWYERSGGLPDNLWVRGCREHPYDTHTTYALMTGFNAGQKVYRSYSRGQNWQNISGNLPNVPMGDIVPHPTNGNILYVGTEFGCYRTTDGGSTWHRWNNGMPKAAIVTEMSVIDWRNQDGRYYVVAATYGRGIWRREINGDDPVSDVADGLPSPATRNPELRNYPNPFASTTTISFTMPHEGAAELAIYDVNGREVATLLDGAKLPAGPHAVPFDGAKLSAGAYWYRLKTADREERKRMTIVR